MLRYATLCVTLITIALGCTGMGDGPETKSPTQQPVPEEPSVTPSETIEKTPERKAIPVGWTLYKNDELGFEVAGPGQPLVQSLDNASQKLTNQVFQYAFPNDGGNAQVLIMTYIGPEEYDLAKGLDGACNGAIQNIKGTMLRYESVEIDGRPAREFEYELETGGFLFAGKGKAIGVAPKTIKMAMTFYPKSERSSYVQSAAFIDLFRVTDTP